MNMTLLKNKCDKLCQDIALLSQKFPLKIVTAESCTAGLICSSLTNLAGSSHYIEGGLITYSNEMKKNILDVSENSLNQFGAVSEQVAKEMVQGALKKTPNANCAVSVTGIAGPDGGSFSKPIGLVWIAFKQSGHQPVVQKNNFYGNRNEIRLQATINAVVLIKKHFTWV